MAILFGGLMTHYVGDNEGVDVVLQNDDPSLQIGSGYTQKDFLHKTRFAIPGGAISTNFQYSISSNISRFDKLNDPGIETEIFEMGNGRLWASEKSTWSCDVGAILRSSRFINTTFAYQNIEESRIKRRFGCNHEEVQNENVMSYEFSLAFITI